MPVRLCMLGLLSLAFASPAGAASLSVSPIGIERVAPAAAASLTLRNEGERTINVQVRVFRWSQAAGEETLSPTRDVAVSPPMTSLAPGVDYTVRLVRLSKEPVAGEEAYRVLVDELPDRSGGGDTMVQLVVRYSIPVFFREPGVGRPDVAWKARVDGRTVRLVADNSGATRLKVGRMTLRDAAGEEFELSAGLLGYVLANSSMEWKLPAGGTPAAGPGELAIAIDGAVRHVPVTLQPGG